MKKFICPFTGNHIEPLAIGNYLRYAPIKFNIESNQLRLKLYASRYGDKICSKDGIADYYNTQQYSIPMFIREFGMTSSVLFFLLDYYSIPRRNIKEASKNIATPKRNITILQKYGVSNVSQINAVKDKKKQTFISHYGVDNIRKHPPFYDYIKERIVEKYGITLSELQSTLSKKTWTTKTPLERQQWLDASIHSEKSFVHAYRKGYNKSKLEDRICLILNKLGVPYQHTFLVQISNKKRYFYDFYLKDLNLILEIHGDYWHANPHRYKPNDLVHYKFDIIKASDIWERDAKKIDYASSMGYITHVIWEYDIVRHERENTIDAFILNEIETAYENSKNKIN